MKDEKLKGLSDEASRHLTGVKRSMCKERVGIVAQADAKKILSNFEIRNL